MRVQHADGFGILAGEGELEGRRGAPRQVDELEKLMAFAPRVGIAVPFNIPAGLQPVGRTGSVSR